MKSNKLLSFLRSNNFALTIAILSVVVQSFHSYTAFYNTSTLKGTAWGMAQAVLFAVIIDLAILFYTVRRRTDIARLAALVMVIINSYYYYQSLGISFEFIFGVFLSLIIPVSVYFYSEEIGKEDPEGNAYHYAKIIEDKDEEFVNLKKQYEATVQENGQLRTANDYNHKLIIQKDEEIERCYLGEKDLRKKVDQLKTERDSALNSLNVSESGFEAKLKKLKDDTIVSLSEERDSLAEQVEHWQKVARINKESLNSLIESDARKVLIVDGKEVPLQEWNDFIEWKSKESKGLPPFIDDSTNDTTDKHDFEIPRTDRPARERKS